MKVTNVEITAAKEKKVEVTQDMWWEAVKTSHTLFKEHMDAIRRLIKAHGFTKLHKSAQSAIHCWEYTRASGDSISIYGNPGKNKYSGISFITDLYFCYNPLERGCAHDKIWEMRDTKYDYYFYGDTVQKTAPDLYKHEYDIVSILPAMYKEQMKALERFIKKV